MDVLGVTTSGKDSGRSGNPSLLFEYALKFLLVSAFLELVLYRLASRLGMHMAKLAEKSEAVRITFKTLSSLGFFLLNVTSILLFLVLFILLIQKLKPSIWSGSFDRFLLPSVSLLLVLTVVYLVFPPAMLGAVLYNTVSLGILMILMAEFWRSHHLWNQRITIGCFVLGILGWIYYQTVSTTYGLLGILDAPPLVHEISRGGEAFMVLASILVLWSYGSTSFFSKNKTQRKWAMTLLVSGGVTFLAFLYIDFFLSLYSPGLAEEARKAGQGIGWVFQMGMGYTFYLPFALYLAGFTCWAYTVIKLVMIGRLAGYGLGLMFMAGYALQLSHLTLMVVVGLILMTLDKRGTLGKLRDKIGEPVVYSPVAPVLSEIR
ncbi:hypothetical protein [Candidatus Nitronereus thalassa]|uniref:Uncharacterized protein n=1 Tax=Candidatus Nitronereus thalassa TaxID=3020898 RepID=A0ABU3KCJ5_9BACT|nr:hypothetical protein [Candidatus Nitronereus thalassa]MDT7044152.1 hypothetical protein [Candidatus Nitronereus thalassa]